MKKHEVFIKFYRLGRDYRSHGDYEGYSTFLRVCVRGLHAYFPELRKLRTHKQVIWIRVTNYQVPQGIRITPKTQFLGKYWLYS